MSSVFTIENKYDKNYLFWLLFLLIFKAAISLLLIAFYDVNLAPDEAQYWTWSKQLDWGYFSKPPAIAWQIFLTTALFGDNELGIRFGAVLISFFLPLITYSIAATTFKSRTAFWAGIVMAFSPLGIFLSFMATTDGGMMLFLTLAIYSVARGLEEAEGPNYVIAGIWILLSALYKWTGFIFWPITLCFFPFFPKLRKWSVLFGIAISLLALLPSLYWNFAHDFATFRHVGTALVKKVGRHGNFLDFFLAQMGLFSPVYWGLLFLSYFFMRNRLSLYCAAYPFLFVFYFIAAFFKRIQPNWGLFLYPAATVPVAWFAIERLKSGRIWIQLGTWISILFSTFAIAIPYLQSNNLLPIPYTVNPFRQNMGWKNLSSALQTRGYNPEQDFLFGDKYQTASILSFYGPEKKRAYFFNLNGDRKNQFSYWPQIAKEGSRGFFVVMENVKDDAIAWYKEHYMEKLKPYFGEIEYMGVSPLFISCEEAVKQAIFFKCLDFKGIHPSDPEKY